MFSPQTYTARRAALRTKIGGGLVLLPGNMPSPNNYPNNTYYYRQDSTFLYYFGLDIPSLVGVLDADSGEEMLFGDDFTVEDIIWTGPQPTLHELGAQVGVTATFPMAELEKYLRKALQQGRRIHYLPPYRGETKLQLAELLGIAPSQLHDGKSVDLMFAVAEMREVKSAEEIEEMERAFRIGYEMHTLAMKMCRPGVVEREIAGAIEGVSKSMGSGVSFPSIVSQHGETLHNLCADGVLEAGRLLLVDAGGETVGNYCSDHTRTYPVSGKFTPRQREIYEIVLAAHDHVPTLVRPGMMYTEIHNAACLRLAEGLAAVGLIKGPAADAVAAGAMTLFMPHGLGHGLGLDVHDCEAMGERSFDFSSIAGRAAASGTCVYRAAWRLRPGTVLTDEPGIYFIPALIDKCRAEGLYKGIVDYDALDAYRDFGGIRIEDDLLVTETGCRFLGDRRIPATVDELETVVGK
ncbi:MAG: aminopeptidase P family protein [Alistipes sp.]|nr:aminopeptidase P family protein [Alistipes sp.]